MSKQLTMIAKAVIFIVSIGHLIFTNIHVKALLLLEHEMCGFIMFLFVLVGLVALFEATRIRNDAVTEKAATAAICAAAGGLGFYLISIYKNAIAVQRSLDIAVVNKAALFSTVVVLAYAISAVLIIVDVVRNR